MEKVCLNWPLPLVGRSSLTKWLPSFPLQDTPGQDQLILCLDDNLLYLAHAYLLLSLLYGAGLLDDCCSLIDNCFCVLPVRIVKRHLGQSSQVLAVQHTQGVGGVLGHCHASQAGESFGVGSHLGFSLSKNCTLMRFNFQISIRHTCSRLN